MLSLSLSLRRVAQATRPLTARSFTVVVSPRKDFVQDLYLKELKAYKPSATPSPAGAVKSYSTPSAPQAPKVPEASELAKELDEYESHTPSVDAPASASSSSSSSVESDGGETADEYLGLVEADVVKEVKH